jgi:hypothetical protein
MTRAVNVPPDDTVEPGMKLLEVARSPRWILAVVLSACPSQKNGSSHEPDARSDRTPEAPAPPAAASGDVDIEPKEGEGKATLPRNLDAAMKRAREPFGGSWIGCYAHYKPASTPERDVTRLALLCGPENGMQRVGSMLTGEAAESVSEHAFDVRSGECFRIFAVAGPAVSELSVEVYDANEIGVASDGEADRWSVLMRDGPLCPREGGKYTVRVRARQGKDKYALEIWRLP